MDIKGFHEFKKKLKEITELTPRINEINDADLKKKFEEWFNISEYVMMQLNQKKIESRRKDLQGRVLMV